MTVTARPVYGYGYRLIAANFIFTRVMPAYLLDALGQTIPAARVYGVPPEMVALCPAYIRFGVD